MAIRPAAIAFPVGFCVSVLVSIIRIGLGFLAAVLAAGVVQVLFVAGLDDLAGLTGERAQRFGLLILLASTQSAVFAAPFAFLAAAFAAWVPIRSWFFFAAAGLVTALAGFLAQYAGEAGPQTIFNRYALAAYLASGLVAGLTYWLVSIRKSSPRPAPAA